MTNPSMVPLRLSEETCHVLKILALELERIGQTYLDVKMVGYASIYYDIARKLKAAAENKVKPIPKLIFSYGHRSYDDPYYDGY